MPKPHYAVEHLDTDLARLQLDQLVVIELDTIEDLLVEPTADAFTLRRGPARSGIDDLVLTLCSAKKLPDRLSVRVVLPAGATPSRPTSEVEVALRRAATDQSTVAWREGMAVRSMGRRQTPIGVVIAVVAAFAASAFGWLASDVEPMLAKVVFLVMGGVSITIAWLVSWMVLELAILDWRQAGRRAAAYDLLARADLEVTFDTTAD